MFALAFFNPLLLWALPLAAVPIIIHLLNRRRFNKVPWAAMEYLLRAMKRNRRRMQMEHWIVLLLRTLAVLFLIFLVTRPQLTSGGGLLKARSHHLVCLDDSASMAQRIGTGNIYKAGVNRVHGLVGKLVDSNSGDLLTLLLSSQSDAQPLLFAVRINQELKGKIREALAGHRVGDGALNAGKFLAAAKKWASEKAEEARDHHYYVITDSRIQDFVKDGKPDPGVLKHLQEMDAAHGQVTVLLVGPKETDNLGITSVRRRDRLATAGASVTLEVEVANFGDEASRPTEIAVTIDSKTNVVRGIPSIPAGGQVVVDIEHTFREPGFHGIVATLPKDRYPVDNQGSLALEVVGSSQVLVVNGDPGQKPEESETFYLNKALDLGSDIITGIDVTEILPHSFLDYDLTHINMVWLANVPSMRPKEVEKLEAFAASGGGVVLFLGDQIADPDQYNKAFYKDGEGLMALPILDLRGDADQPDHAFVADRSHFTMKDNIEVLEVVLSKWVLVRRYFELAEDPAAPVAIPVRINSATGHPLVATKTFKRGGETVTVATTADDAWSDLCISPAYLVMCQEIHKYATKAHSLAPYNLSSTGTLKLDLDPAIYRRDVLVRSLAGEGFEKTFTTQDQSSDPGEGDGKTEVDGKVNSILTVPMSELEGLGLFYVSFTPHRGELENRLISRNAPIAEGRLQRLQKPAWLRVYPADVQDRLNIIEETKEDTAVAGVGEGELWRVLAIALLAFLLLETVLAWRFGRR